MHCEIAMSRTSHAVEQTVRALLEQSSQYPSSSFALETDTQLSALGLDSLALVGFFLQLEGELHVPPSVLPLLLRRACTFGQLVSSLTTSSQRPAVFDQVAEERTVRAHIHPTV
jgi:acyl carrier protein